MSKEERPDLGLLNYNSFTGLLPTLNRQPIARVPSYQHYITSTLRKFVSKYSMALSYVLHWGKQIVRLLSHRQST